MATTVRIRHCAGRVVADYGSYPCENEAECFVKRVGAWLCIECARRLTGVEGDVR